jgi:hypothetical protein
MKSIKTAAGLREAVWDVICDECPGKFTAKWMQERLPYGARVRRVLGELVDAGAIRRTAWGVYERVKG